MAGTGAATTKPQGRSEGRFGKGQGLLGMGKAGGTSGGWEPTVVNLLLLVFLEFAAYIGARYLLKNVHGG